MKKTLLSLLIFTNTFTSNPQLPPAPPMVQPQFYREYPNGTPQQVYYRTRPRRPMSTSKLIAISAATSVVTSCFTCLLLTKVRW